MGWIINWDNFSSLWKAPRKIPPAANTPGSRTLLPLGCTLKCRGQKNIFQHFPALQLSCSSSAVRTGIDNCHCCHLLLKVTLLVQMQSVALCPLFSCWVTPWLCHIKMCSNDKYNQSPVLAVQGGLWLSECFKPAGSTASLETVLISSSCCPGVVSEGVGMLLYSGSKYSPQPWQIGRCQQQKDLPFFPTMLQLKCSWYEQILRSLFWWCCE